MKPGSIWKKYLEKEKKNCRVPRMLLTVIVVSALIADAVIIGGVYWSATYDSSILNYVTQQNMLITAVSVLVIGLVLTTVCTYFSVTHCLKMRGSELY